ncbi:DUF4062 domain-containing protein [bacterium]|nr:DUF4062 domain-containing protein [bacterium]
MDKRFQVFVSSTYSDLQEERQEIMQALLELDCIPSGMELFPAANEDQWTLIKKVIDDCDYYIVIIGGRYGSTSGEGISYTEMEYKYAVDKNKPVIAFLHEKPDALPVNRCEKTEDGKKKLALFRELTEKKMCKYWDSPADLGSKVSRSIIKLIKEHPAIGWVRGDQVSDENFAKENLSLRKKVEELEKQLNAVKIQKPEGTENLAQGEEEFLIEFKVPTFSGWGHDEQEYSTNITWNSIFAAVSPVVMNEVKENEFLKVLDEFLSDFCFAILKEQKDVKMEFNHVHIDRKFHQTIKIQLCALGLIEKSTKPRSVHDTDVYWTLTPYGEFLMYRLRAVPSKSRNSINPSRPGL